MVCMIRRRYADAQIHYYASHVLMRSAILRRLSSIYPGIVAAAPVHSLTSLPVHNRRMTDLSVAKQASSAGNKPGFHVQHVPCLSDNYAYIIVDKQSQAAAWGAYPSVVICDLELLRFDCLASAFVSAIAFCVMTGEQPLFCMGLSEPELTLLSNPN